MKKHIFLFAIAILSCLQLVAIGLTTNMNPFAYNLKATLNADQSVLTVKYCLNAEVKSLKIVIEGGGQTITHNVTESSKLQRTVADKPYFSPYEITIPITDLGVGTYTWRIEVQGKGRDDIEIYSQNGTSALTYPFYLPSSVDIVKDTRSFNYGKVIVVEGSHSGKGNGSYHSNEIGAGLYVYNPDFTPILNKNSKPGFNGGSKTWNNNTSNSYFANTGEYPLRRVRVSKDGRIFVTSMHEKSNSYVNGHVLWEVDPNFSRWGTVMGKGINGTTYDYATYQLKTSTNAYIAGPTAGFDVRGEGEELTLLMLSCDESAFRYINHTYFHLNEYNLGTDTTWSSTPTKTIDISSVFIAPEGSNVQYDSEGGIWCISNRSAADDTYPGWVHISPSGTRDLKKLINNQQNAAIRFNHDFSQVIIGGKSSGTPLHSYSATIYTVGKDNSGNPALTEESTIDMSATGRQLNDFAWDPANNIYAVGAYKQDGTDGHVAVYCLPYNANDVFTTPGPSTFTLTETICWHPYPAGYEVTNEDLWETFQSDYNDWYMYHESATQKVNTKKAHQSITNAYSFTFPSDKTPQGEYEHPDGLVSDFLTNNVSKWKWLGDYIKEVANPTSVPATNEELWEEFKLYYKTFYGENRSDQSITNALTFMTQGKTILTEASSKYKWLGDYIISVAAQQQITIGSGDYDNENTYRNFLKAFLNKEHLENYWDGIANKRVYPNVDFTEAGKPENWLPYYVSPEGKNQIDTEMEWRKEVHAFFNQAKTCTYKNTIGETVTDNTGDYTNAGKPAQWHDEWWNATFKQTMEAYPTDSLPTIRRKGYVLSGWYYGDNDGYSLEDRENTKGQTRGGCCLWARWLETCLYEGYITGTIDNSAANEEMGQQINRNIEFINVMQGKSDYQMKIDRKLQSGAYNTFVIPFALSKKEGAYNYIGKIVDAQSKPLLTGNTSVLCFQGSSIIENGTGEYVLQLNFERWEDTDDENIAANRPILIMPENDITKPMHTTWPPYISSAAFKPLEDDPYVEFIPVLAPSEVQGGAGTNNLILVADNRLARLSSTGTMLGLRGYFNGSQIPDNLAPQQMIIKITEKDGVVTYLDNIETPQQGAAAIKIMQNGTIYILREGKVYDMMGRSLREL